MPRATVIVPRVAINGGSLNFATSKPLSTPISRQQSRVTSRAGIGLMIPFDIRVAATIVLMPTTEPMDRSILPVIRT